MTETNEAAEFKRLLAELEQSNKRIKAILKDCTCGDCVFWSGNCRKGHPNKTASSQSCIDFEPRRLATWKV